MRRIAEPVLESHGGAVIKTEADNLFAVFPDVGPAVVASRELTVELEAVNATAPEDDRLYASIGIGFGSILLVGQERIVGREVNQAFKLGEDVAMRGEILLTEAARRELAEEELSCEPRVADVAGVSLEHYLLLPS